MKELVSMEDFRKAREEIFKEWELRQDSIDQNALTVAKLVTELLRRKLFGLEAPH